jgi:hypothetical protein
MKKTEFQRFAYAESSKAFLKLFTEGKVRKYSLEATYDRQKIKYEPEYGKSMAVYFYRSGKIMIYQKSNLGENHESIYYEWQDASDHKDVSSTLAKELAEFIKRLNNEKDDLWIWWAHNGFYEIAYENSKFRKANPA